MGSAAPWLSKDIISVLVSHIDDLQTARALCLTSKTFNEAVNSQNVLEVLVSSCGVVDFKPLKKGDWTVAETLEKRFKDPKWGQTLPIVILGEYGSGKTCSTQQFLFYMFYEEFDPTLEDLYEKTYKLEQASFRLEILDTATDLGAQESATDRYLNASNGHSSRTRKSYAFVVMYSITSRESFEEAQRILQFAEKHLEEREMWNCILVGNKVDLAKEFRAVSIAEGRKLAKKHQIAFCEASAKTRENLKEWMEYLIINHVRRNLKGIGNAQNAAEKKCILQ
jgi:small GTP-binding protein